MLEVKIFTDDYKVHIKTNTAHVTSNVKDNLKELSAIALHWNKYVLRSCIPRSHLYLVAGTLVKLHFNHSLIITEHCV